MIQPGARFGSYEILAEIARGGQGAVFRARHTSGAIAALKLLFESDREGIKRFAQEARVLCKLSHPNLLRVFEHGEHEGTLFLAVELVNGQDLHALVEENGVPRFEWTCQTLVAVAMTLEHCHQRGVIHRDLKPANVVIEKDTGRPVLVDFGLVKRDANKLHLTSLDESVLSVAGVVKGTPEYMAPEQVNPKEFGEVSPRTDVYGLGATLYHLLTGGPPFRGRVAVVVMRKVTRKEPIHPRERNHKTPDALSQLCLRCLAKSPSERPQTPYEFATLLAQAAGLPVPPAPTPPGSGVLVLSPAGSASTHKPLLPRRLPRAGDTFAGFEIVKPLARGGGGAVYVVRTPAGEVRALKVLLGGVLGGDKRRRFEREAEVGRSLRHPGVVAFEGSGVEQNMAYLVMEYLDNAVPLDRYGRKLPLTARLELMLAVTAAVEAAHAVGLIHRDLKPDNVLVTAGGQVKVLDFGLAKHVDKERMTMSGAMFGTPRYMSPEQVMGRAAQADARTDVFALGVILYEMVSGESPFQGGSNVELMASILSDSPPDPCADVPDAPRGLREVVLKAMALNPEDRYPSAAAFGRDLAALMAGSDAVSALDESRGLARRHLAGRGVLVLLAVLLALGVAAWWTRPSVDPAAQRRRVAKVSLDAWKLLNDGKRPLGEDAPKIAALRAALGAAAEGRAPGAPSRQLANARRRVRVLEGLSALAAGDTEAASAALSALGDGNSVERSALAGGLLSVSRGEAKRAITLLSRALARGIGRVELRVWRARAQVDGRLKGTLHGGLDGGLSEAKQALADFAAYAAAYGELAAPDRMRRARAHLAAKAPEAAAAEVEGLDVPLDLRWAIALPRATRALEDRPQEALGWLSALPALNVRHESQFDLGQRTRRRVESLVRQASLSEDQSADLLALLRILTLVVDPGFLTPSVANAISDYCTNYESQGVWGESTDLAIAVVLGELCPDSVKIQREVSYPIQRVKSRAGKRVLIPALRRLIQIEQDADERRSHRQLLCETLAYLACESDAPPEQIAREVEEVLALSEQLLPHADEKVRWSLLAARSRAKRAIGDLEGALADISAAIEVAPEVCLFFQRMQILRLSDRPEEASDDAARFVLASVENTAHGTTAARCVWKQRARDLARAQRVAAHHAKINPAAGATWARVAWFQMAAGEVDAAKESVDAAVGWFEKRVKRCTEKADRGERVSEHRREAKQAKGDAKLAKKTAAGLAGAKGKELLDALVESLAER